MTDWKLVRHCQEATKALTYINDCVDEDKELDKAEAASLYVFFLAVRELNNSLDGDEDDDNPFKFDDDHTFK